MECLSFVCVWGKMVNLAMKMTKDMPIMKSAFPKGSGVQTHCCLFNWLVGQEKQEWKGRTLIFCVFAFQAVKPSGSQTDFYFFKDKTFIAFGFNWQFHTRESGRIWERRGWHLMTDWSKSREELYMWCSCQYINQCIHNNWYIGNIYTYWFSEKKWCLLLQLYCYTKQTLHGWWKVKLMVIYIG